jgi:hypothetical protein
MDARIELNGEPEALEKAPSMIEFTVKVPPLRNPSHNNMRPFTVSSL